MCIFKKYLSCLADDLELPLHETSDSEARILLFQSMVCPSWQVREGEIEERKNNLLELIMEQALC